MASSGVEDIGHAGDGGGMSEETVGSSASAPPSSSSTSTSTSTSSPPPQPPSKESKRPQQRNNCENNDEGGAGDAEIYFNRKFRMELLKPHHIQYCKVVLLTRLPSSFEDYDTQRMTFLHFAVTSLDILKGVDALKPEEKERIVNWVYKLQITGEPTKRSGFQGSTTFLMKKMPGESGHNQSPLPVQLFSSHITMTYAALVTLLTLGDDLERIDRHSILKGVAALQNQDGCFQASLGCTEKDMRFVYCAVCICYLLNDFSQINIPKLVEFIRNSFTYEGSFTSGYGVEGHAAFTFCAVASLFLLNRFDETFSADEVERLQRWCLFRQEGGFSGRPNKAEDTCYSYWVVATLALINSVDMFDKSRNIDFLLGNQNPLIGGIGKCDNEHVDPLHTFLGLAGLSLVNYKGLNSINPMLTMSENALEHMRRIHSKWRA